MSVSARPGSSMFAATLLRRQIDELRAADADVRAGEPDAIHDVRIAARRLRSTLTSYRRLLPPTEARGLTEELRWLGSALSPARDAQVMRARLLGELADTPDDLVVGPVGDRIRSALDADARRGQEAAAEALSSARYSHLLRDLDALTTVGTPSDTPERSAARSVRRALRADVRLARRAVRATRADMSAPDQDVALHEARKKAKRLHYAAESAAEVLGRPADELAEAAHGVQDLLGEHQDSVVARQYLIRLANAQRAAGEDTFTVGLLHAREQAAARTDTATTRAAWRRIARAARRLER
ncbi:MAG TPA: CHAD domain-containing protein [Cellulomonas sp.]|uniref:CHAD domain-containing protein n=1 Tax=Cellulomonas sp. TaxID=40001 RepID=UPI002E373B26|nr:CHAD domain-containing protein [Cellulomonas sp.]HEX5333538.1 CHAD domain-containing protein [Cellulomonas sp.]